LTGRFLETPFTEALTKFEQYTAKEAVEGLPAGVIGKVIYHALTTKHPEARQAVVPSPVKNWIIPRMIPMRTLDKLIAQFFEIKRKAS